MPSLVEKLFLKDRAALARLITQVESRTPDLSKIFAALEKERKRSAQNASFKTPQIIGFTGPPGAGKSTLVDQMIGAYRKEAKEVGVIAVDPSSPFSGGALLGDRIRMMSHAEDPGVFIRSLGSRGAHGGLSKATHQIVELMEAFGMDVILIETVGVGQTELDVLQVAQTTVVVLTPESGDTVQTLKAGLLEAADIFVVNKADREGATKIQNELNSMLEMGSANRKFEKYQSQRIEKNSGAGSISPEPSFKDWRPPVLKIQASHGVGIEALKESLQLHHDWLLTHPYYSLQKQEERQQEFTALLKEQVLLKLAACLEENPLLQKLAEEVQNGNYGPFEAAQKAAEGLEIRVGKR